MHQWRFCRTRLKCVAAGTPPGLAQWVALGMVQPFWSLCSCPLKLMGTPSICRLIYATLVRLDQEWGVVEVITCRLV